MLKLEKRRWFLESFRQTAADFNTSGTEPSTPGETSYSPPPSPPTKAEQEAYMKKGIVELGSKLEDASSGGNSDAWALTFGDMAGVTMAGMDIAAGLGAAAI